jgi:glucose/arabinose dehydrogenase
MLGRRSNHARKASQPFETKWGSAALTACPVVEAPLTEETTVKNVPRPKRPRERTATPAELEDERQRWLRATTPPRTRESIQALRAGLDETRDMPAMPMRELVKP